MVVVPTLPHRWNCGPGNVMCLHSAIVHQPVLRSAGVAPVTDQPVHGYTHRHAYTDSPNHPRHAADREQHQCQRQLLQHPSSLQESIERVITNAWTRIEAGWTREVQAAVKIPDSVPPKPPTVF